MNLNDIMLISKSEHAALLDKLNKQTCYNMILKARNAFEEGCRACYESLCKNDFTDASAYLANITKSFSWHDEAVRRYPLDGQNDTVAEETIDFRRLYEGIVALGWDGTRTWMTWDSLGSFAKQNFIKAVKKSQII